MKKILFIALILISITTSIAEISPNEISLEKGKNNITLPDTVSPVYASTIIHRYSEIMAISFTENEKTTGFVNAFGGIGTDFIIYPEKNYEIITNKNTTIILA